MWGSADDYLESIKDRTDGNWYKMYEQNGGITHSCCYLTKEQVIEYLDKGYVLVKDGFELETIHPVTERDRMIEYYKKEADSWKQHCESKSNMLKAYKEKYGKELWRSMLRKDGK